MLWLILAIAIGATALVLMGVGVASRWLETRREHDDRPGVRSAVTFRLRHDEESLAGCLDRLHAALEHAGADASTFQSHGEGFELDGMLGADPFRITLARVELDDELPSSHAGFLLILHARTLGRYRYVAPPDTETTRTLLRAIDGALQSQDDVHGVSWRSRQDEESQSEERP